MYTPTKIGREKKASHHESKYKYDNHSPSRNSTSNSSSKKHPHKDHKTSSVYTYHKNAAESKYVVYDPLTDVSEGYNPECPELFPSSKSLKTKKSSSHKGESSDKELLSKRKLKSEDEAEYVIQNKKLKSSNHDMDYTSHKSSKTKEKHGHKDKDYKSKSSKKGDSDKSDSSQLKKNSVPLDTMKIKSKESSSSKKDKLKPKIKLNSSEEFTSSEVRFEDCLGLNDIVTLKKKKSSKSHSSSIKTEGTSSSIRTEGTTSSKKSEGTTSSIKSEGTTSSKSKSEKSRSFKESSSSKKERLKPQLTAKKTEEFTSSDVRFEDCLGLNDVVTLKKKKSVKTPTSSKHPTVENNRSQPSTSHSVALNKVPKDNLPLKHEKLHSGASSQSEKRSVVDTFSAFSDVYADYDHSLPKHLDFSSSKKKETFTNEDTIRFISSRKEKTAVYSGRKSFYTEIPSLFELCSRILIENIDAIEYMGEVPYPLIKPVLERCTPDQLFNIENFNPYLLEDTHELWEVHCRRDYKLLMPQENETWRDLYLRALDEREKKLKSVTANISASIAKSNPVRQVKMVYVDSYVKPPRDVARRQAKNGTAHPVSSKTESSSKEIKKSTGSSQVFKPAGSSEISKPAGSSETSKPVASSSKETSKPSSSSAVTKPSSSNAASKKPKVAPLMAKTLKSLRHFRR